MAQVSRKIWKINMVGTIQANQTGAPMVSYLKANPMKKRTYEYKMWQHNTRLLVAAVWSDNGLVKTLSNYHQPIIVADGLMRKKMGADNVRDKHQSPVDAPKQNIDYSKTFHQIDKGNMIESDTYWGKKEARNMAGHPNSLFI